MEKNTLHHLWEIYAALFGYIYQWKIPANPSWLWAGANLLALAGPITAQPSSLQLTSRAVGITSWLRGQKIGPGTWAGPQASWARPWHHYLVSQPSTNPPFLATSTICLTSLKRQVRITLFVIQLWTNKAIKFTDRFFGTPKSIGIGR